MKPVAFDIYNETRRDRDAKAREVAFLRARAAELDAKVADLKRQLKLTKSRLRQADQDDNSIDAMQRQAQQFERANVIRGW